MTYTILAYSNFTIYLLGVIFFLEVFAPRAEDKSYHFVVTALIWPFIAVKLIINRLMNNHHTDEGDDES